eukprot:30998-Eustigmatos_ZCMA.PRE.1
MEFLQLQGGSHHSCLRHSQSSVPILKMSSPLPTDAAENASCLVCGTAPPGGTSSWSCGEPLSRSSS